MLLFMKKDKGVYDKVCGYINPYLSKDMNVLELACGSGQLSLTFQNIRKVGLQLIFLNK